MQKFPGQGSNLHHGNNLSHSSDNTRSLSHWDTRELHWVGHLHKWGVSHIGWKHLGVSMLLSILFQFLFSCCSKPGRHTLSWQDHVVRASVSLSNLTEESCPRGWPTSQSLRPWQEIKLYVLSHWEFRSHLLPQQMHLFFLFIFLTFLGVLSWHMEVPRLGV